MNQIDQIKKELEEVTIPLPTHIVRALIEYCEAAKDYIENIGPDGANFVIEQKIGERFVAASEALWPKRFGARADRIDEGRAAEAWIGVK